MPDQQNPQPAAATPPVQPPPPRRAPLHVFSAFIGAAGLVLIVAAGWALAWLLTDDGNVTKKSGNNGSQQQEVQSQNENSTTPTQEAPEAAPAQPRQQGNYSLTTTVQQAPGTTNQAYQQPRQYIRTPEGDYRFVPVTTQDGLIPTSPGTTQEYTNMPAMRYRPYPAENGSPQWQLGTDRAYIPAYVTEDPTRAQEALIPSTVTDPHGNKHHVLVAKPVQRLAPELTKALAPEESDQPQQAIPEEDEPAVVEQPDDSLPEQEDAPEDTDAPSENGEGETIPSEPPADMLPEGTTA